MEAITAHASELAELAVEEDEILRSCGPPDCRGSGLSGPSPGAPHIDETVSALFTDFFEQRGDRQCKGRPRHSGRHRPFSRIAGDGHRPPQRAALEENLACNFGMPGPEGYRKALRHDEAGRKVWPAHHHLH